LCVLARWRHAKGATKDSRGQVNVPVVVGGTTIRPGDIVVLDDDGAVSIAAADVADAVRAVRERIVKESELRSRWARGELSYDVYGMRAEDAARERL
jgi:4-hydroxy-4-methyl-2-oxoglutarate aldolase